MSKIWMIVGAVVVIVVVGLAVWFGFSRTPAGPAVPQQASDAGDTAPASEVSEGETAETVLKEGDRILGDPAAPVTIIEYASLTCPHCANFHHMTLPELQSEYIDAGQVKLAFRDFPLDQLALRAASLAQCVPPERYFGFLGVLFESQSTWATAEDPVAALSRMGRTAGLEDSEIQSCLEDDEKLDQIVSERLEGEQTFGISSTPSFVIGGKTYSGALTIDQLRGIIDPMLQ